MNADTTAMDPVTQLEAIARALQTSEDILRNGGSIDLKGVDQQVELLCAEVVKTEGPMRLKLLPMLENVIQSLDRLEAGLRQITYKSDDDGADRRLRAQSAYGGRKPDQAGT
jgi:hypothetical protein